MKYIGAISLGLWACTLIGAGASATLQEPAVKPVDLQKALQRLVKISDRLPSDVRQLLFWRTMQASTGQTGEVGLEDIDVQAWVNMLEGIPSDVSGSRTVSAWWQGVTREQHGDYVELMARYQQLRADIYSMLAHKARQASAGIIAVQKGRSGQLSDSKGRPIPSSTFARVVTQTDLPAEGDLPAEADLATEEDVNIITRAVSAERSRILKGASILGFNIFAEEKGVDTHQELLRKLERWLYIYYTLYDSFSSNATVSLNEALLNIQTELDLADDWDKAQDKSSAIKSYVERYVTLKGVTKPGTIPVFKHTGAAVIPQAVEAMAAWCVSQGNTYNNIQSFFSGLNYVPRSWYQLAPHLSAFTLTLSEPSVVELLLGRPDLLKAKLRVLKLSLCHLTQIPQQIFEFSELENLDLSYNDIKEIPVDIAKLPHIKFLDMQGNALSTIPAQMGLVRTLKRINLRENPIEYLPPGTPFFQLKTSIAHLPSGNPVLQSKLFIAGVVMDGTAYNNARAEGERRNAAPWKSYSQVVGVIKNRFEWVTAMVAWAYAGVQIYGRLWGGRPYMMPGVSLIEGTFAPALWGFVRVGTLAERYIVARALGERAVDALHHFRPSLTTLGLGALGGVMGQRLLSEPWVPAGFEVPIGMALGGTVGSLITAYKEGKA